MPLSGAISTIMTLFLEITIGSATKVMSKLGPLAFSVLTPIVKAFMIVACSLYFGDPFGFLSAIGVAISTGGGYLFTLAKNADAESKAAVATASQALKKD
eukprot:TRINITY_DN23514_c0_g1_i2.p2 TRINITY_DN23514_c0_g1~~TRINITY_DN23514_c0_g1_i2.p2  ORF type:complete len:100 (+),score=17.99 TRINITY_DN23514_c0_g1_i2:55-354(+)